MPAEIYAIPPSSPLYYATYVRIYDATPTTVTVGYLPGYMGTYVADGTVVYGTGYAYAPYIGTTVWYGPPVTYGYAAGIAWTPWTGWGYRLRHGLGLRRRVGRGCVGLGRRAVLGCVCRRGLGRGGRRTAPGGPALGGELGQHVSPVGQHHRRDAFVRRLQRVDRQRLVGTGRALVQLADGADLGGPARHGRQRLHRQLRVRDARRDIQPDHRRLGIGRARHRRQRVHGAVDQRRARERRADPAATTCAPRRWATTTTPTSTATSTRTRAAAGSNTTAAAAGAAPSGEGARSMESEQQARDMGEQRSGASSWGGGERSYGSGFRGSGSEPESHGGFDRGGGMGGGGFRGGGGRGRR